MCEAKVAVFLGGRGGEIPGAGVLHVGWVWV